MEITPMVVSILSLLVSMVALGFSIYSKIKSSLLANENTRLANGMIELEVRQSISSETSKVNEISIQLNPYIAKQKEDTLSGEDAHVLAALQKNWKAAVQGMLNVYEEACTKYIDNKVDKNRFKKNYHIEIRNILEAEGLKDFFDPHTSRYKAILRVYNEWENLEQ